MIKLIESFSKPGYYSSNLYLITLFAKSMNIHINDDIFNYIEFSVNIIVEKELEIRKIADLITGLLGSLT